MTVIAAVARHGQVAMAADTATNYAITTLTGVRKITRLRAASGRNDVLVAAAGGGALLSVARGWTPDDPPQRADATDDDWHAWAATAATTLTARAADAKPTLVGDQGLNGAFLLGVAGRLFYVFTNQAVPVPRGIAAIGNGSDYALGFMEAALDHGLDPGDPDYEWVVNAAVDGACAHYDGCSVDEGPNGGALVEVIGS